MTRPGDSEYSDPLSFQGRSHRDWVYREDLPGLRRKHTEVEGHVKPPPSNTTTPSVFGAIPVQRNTSQLCVVGR